MFDGSARGNKKKRMLPHRPTMDQELEAPTVANRALELMLILDIAQKKTLSPGGTPQDTQSQMNRTKQNRQKHHITVRDLLRFLTTSRRFS